jgi:hypothetical protein
MEWALLPPSLTPAALPLTLALGRCWLPMAQRCAWQMAATDRLEHCGSMGQRAENVAYGYQTEAKTIAAAVLEQNKILTAHEVALARLKDRAELNKADIDKPPFSVSVSSLVKD